MLDRVIRITGLKPENVLNVYQYGSRVYETATHQSDFDFIVINNAGVNDREVRNGDFNVHIYTVEHFQELINQHKIFALECLFLPQDKILQQKIRFAFTLNKTTLRHEISAKSSNSWVKCKKKLEVEKDCEYIGKKSLFHALRIVLFGTQLATQGRITDYTAANHFFHDIMSSGRDDWAYYKETYQSVFNNLCTEFRKVAEK